MKVALVTGASSGVGEALSPMLARSGYRVFGMSRRRVDIPGVEPLPADVSKPDTVKEAISTLLSETGGHLDCVVHCAGIGGAGPVEQMPLDRANTIMDTNFWGSYHICQACLPALLEAPAGRLLLVGSIAGFMGIPFRSVYCASKAGLIALTDSLRLETSKSSLQISCVCPGDIATNSIATQFRMPVKEVKERYRSAYEAADSGMAENVDHGMSAEYVAEQLQIILNKNSLKPRYVVGPPLQRASTIARRILPGKLWERVLKSYYS
ncbi:MAG: SDR family NAD(P)-dependent oxidoreductase [Bacteroidota bacterium]